MDLLMVAVSGRGRLAAEPHVELTPRASAGSPNGKWNCWGSGHRGSVDVLEQDDQGRQITGPATRHRATGRFPHRRVPVSLMVADRITARRPARLMKFVTLAIGGFVEAFLFPRLSPFGHLTVANPSWRNASSSRSRTATAWSAHRLVGRGDAASASRICVIGRTA